MKKDVSVIENTWNDGQRVDQTDMIVEQTHNNEIDAAIVQNHFGSGILPYTLQQNVIFDSESLVLSQDNLLATGNFDGTGLFPINQPSDPVLGNQLEVELTNSTVSGRLSVKVAIIGLSFDDVLQMDRLYFYANEKQVTSKHYKEVFCVFTNDFKGNNFCSRNLGGELVVREADSFQLSKDPVMISQDVQPDIWNGLYQQHRQYHFQ